MKALSLFSFLVVLPVLLFAQKEQQQLDDDHRDKTFFPSPIGLEISYDDGDTYYYYNNNKNNHNAGKKILPPPVPYVPPKQTTFPPQQTPNHDETEIQIKKQNQTQTQNEKQEQTQIKKQNEKQEQTQTLKLKQTQKKHNNLRRHHDNDDNNCHHHYHYPPYNENHWTYEDDNDTMRIHRRCWLYRDKHKCRRAECCWFQGECHGCHDEHEDD